MCLKIEKYLERVVLILILNATIEFQIDKETEIVTPATYIPKKKKAFNWTIITLSISVMVGMFLSKNKFFQKLWNE